LDTLATAGDRACANFFLMPASIEVARIRRKVLVPIDLRLAYDASLKRIPSFVPTAAARSWDDEMCQSVLAAVAASQSRHAIAELLLDIDVADIPDVLKSYFSR
jgi:hypothetical protein